MGHPISVYFEKSRSFWMEKEPLDFAPLRESLRVDVAVVGAGIAGLSAAYELLRRGRSVAVFDRGPVARGMSARTTAHLTSSCDDLFTELIKKRGEDVAKAYYESQLAAVERIETIANEEGIACDFTWMDGYLWAASEDDEKTLDEELEACRAVGLHGAEKLAKSSFPGLSNHACLRFPRQGRFHPLLYLDGLAESIGRRGGRIFADTAVTSVDESSGSVSITVIGGLTIEAQAAVIATNSPIVSAGAVHSKQAPYRTYAIAADIEDASRIEDVLYWDTEEPYHYVRFHPNGGGYVLIAGGEDHKTGTKSDMAERLARLEGWARERFPRMGEVRWRWSGQVMEPIDFAGFIGKAPGAERTFIATGDSGQGITSGVLAGMMLGEAVTSGSSRWAKAYDPARKPVSAAAQFVSENVSAIKELAGHVTPGEIKGADELGPGEGGLLRSGLSKLAVSRKEDGRLNERSASCTHLGCTVHWNPFEQCWDCPCHGSHFAPDGAVLNAPALKPLADAKA